MSFKKKSMTRREFIGKSSIGLAAAGTFNTFGIITGRKPFINLYQKEMITRTLGKTGIELPVVSLGVMNADNPNVVQHAVDSGMKLLDTAWGYQGGRNEEMIGEVLKKNGIRKDITIISKIPYPGRRRGASEMSGEEIQKDFLEKFEESLRRLQTDYIDIMCLHNVTTRDLVNNKAIVDVLSRLKREGRIKHPAFSTHSNQDIVIDEAANSKFYEVIVASYNFIDPKKEKIKSAMSKAVKAGIGMVAMKTQCGGFLDRSQARRNGVKPSKPVNHKACLRWVLQNEDVTTGIPGCTAYDQIDELMEVAYDLEMTDEEKSFIGKAGDMGSAFYCSGCEECSGTCPKNVDVPTIMRTHMYAFAYNNREHAKLTYDEIPEECNLSNCVDCEECTVTCANNLDAPGNISLMREFFV